VFINDVPTLPSITLALFADDIAVWPRFDDSADGDRKLQIYLVLLSTWAKQWHIVFSPAMSATIVNVVAFDIVVCA